MTYCPPNPFVSYAKMPFGVCVFCQTAFLMMAEYRASLLDSASSFLSVFSMSETWPSSTAIMALSEVM